LPADRFGVPGELFLITILGALLRGYRLGAQGFWIDEVFMTTMATERSLSELLFVVPQFEPHPPLYNVFMWAWVGIFGTSEIAMRSSSVLFSIATIPLVYLLVRRLFDRPTAVIVGTFVAVSPFQIWYAQEARMYAPLVLLTVASFYLLVRLTESYTRRTAIGYVAVGVALAYLHIYGLFVLLAQVLFLGWQLAGNADTEVRPFRRLVGIYGSIGLLTSPWTGLLLHRLVAPDQYPADAAAWLQPPALDVLVEALSLLSFGVTPATRPYSVLSQPPRLFLLAVAVPLVVLVGLNTMGEFRSERSELRLLFLWLLVPILVPFLISVTVRPIFQLRYVIVAAPAFLILVARGIQSLSSRPVRYGLVLLILTGMFVPLPGYYTEPHKDQWDDAAAYVSENADAGDVIIVVPGWTWTGPSDGFRHYFGRQDVAVSPLYSFSSQDEYRDAVTDGGDVYLVLSYTNERAGVLDSVSSEVGHGPTETREFVSIVVATYEQEN
jgi:4-amino-4-deoxy-L-arabinose transferase-like glycosyltransferase